VPAECLSGERNKMAVSDAVGKGMEAANSRPSSIVEGIKEMIKDPKKCPKGLECARGLVRLPFVGPRAIDGPCSSHHYRHRNFLPPGINAYADPLTACVMLAVMHEWNKGKKDVNGNEMYCPKSEKRDCRIAVGDFSHARKINKQRGWPHKSHTYGQCFDMRPMQQHKNGGFVAFGCREGARCYDREKMRNFGALLYEKGGTNMFFSDTSVPGVSESFRDIRSVKYLKRTHNDHLHACIGQVRPSNTWRQKKERERQRHKAIETCKNFQPEPEVCPNLFEGGADESKK
jgi:hypothetical protein